MKPQPFTIEISDEDIADLKRRLRETRWPDEVAGAEWDYGTPLSYLKELCKYWLDEFDWRAKEKELNQLDHYRANVDGLTVHYVWARAQTPNALPLIATHGWPSTFFELLKLIPLLTEPDADGIAFDLVIPSMPGYGFSDRPNQRYFSANVPELWRSLMQGLGYETFFAHGGDIGGGITARLGQRHSDVVKGIHVTNVYGAVDETEQPATEAEARHLEQQEAWFNEDWAYGVIQGHRPQTLGYGLNDSPAGLAAWIIEKYRAWSDCGGNIETVFTKDELLTNISIYWFTQTIASSFRPYYDNNHNPRPYPWVKVLSPAAVAVFPADIATPPREFAERWYDVRQWTEMPHGGHFAALEQPDLLSADIRRFFARLASD